MKTNLLQAVFSVRGIGQSTQDEAMTSELLERTGAQTGRLRANKSILKAGLAEWGKQVNRARQWHVANTWQGFGDTRILIPSEIERYKSAMDGHIQNIRYAYQTFISEYDHWKAQDRKALGAAYNDEDYPVRETLPDLFKTELSIYPMPEPNQFLKDAVLGEHGKLLKEEYEQRLKDMTESVRRQILETFLLLIADTAKSLAEDEVIVDSEGRKGPVAKLREYMDRVPALNSDNDPVISAIYSECRKSLDLSTEILRNSKLHRNSAASTAVGIIEKFSGFGQSSRKLAA